MSDGTARYSDPITEQGGWVGRGAVLYDTRDPGRRPCCSQGGRCLAHVTGVFEETETGEVYYRVADGTWTTQEWIHGDDLLALFEPAGWSVTDAKPTYVLTRHCDVEDHHDLMTDGGTVEDVTERPWLNTDTLRERVELLRDEADSVDGEPCDEWYAEQLDGILDETDTEQLGEEYKPCAECGNPVNTVPGMDNFVKVTHYGTTEYAERYYCDDGCLAHHTSEGER